jgi:PIN domain nuclease of toxin-antitoxin system
VTVLLDTHTLLWAVINPSNLGQAAFKLIDNKNTNVLVSAASAWEIATKVRNGKLPGAETFEHTFVGTLDSLGYNLLSIDTDTALRAARLIGTHRDPFDRIIAAQALALDIPVISKDPQLDQFGIRRIW